MLHTIPYNLFFAPRADEKGVFICIYRIKERGKLGGERAVLLTPDFTYTEIADEDRWHSIYIEIRRAGGTGIQYNFLRASRGREGYARSNTIHFFLRASRGREGCISMYIPSGLF